MKFQLTITMQSDWHVGAGAGRRGDIDRLIQRDTDGLPYLPAKTLTGIWRDACELIADGLDSAGLSEDASTSWNQWVDFLFGDQPAIANAALSTAPQPAALSIRAAHLPKSLRNLLKHRAKASNPAHQALQSAFTFIKPGISIDDRGCAKEDFLRFEEMARIGTVLTADCELLAALNPEQQQAACTLLAAGATVVERLGGKRRRGAGRCEFKIDWPEEVGIQQAVWDILARDAPELPEASEDSSDGSEDISEKTNSLEIRSDQSGWQRITIALEALTPLVIPARAIGNVVETLDYIPGTNLLRLVLQQVRSLGVDLGDAVARGDLLVTNATIAIADQPGQPIPACLFYEKSGGGLSKGGTVYNRFCEPEQGSQLKGYRQGYIEFTKRLETLPEYKTVDTLVGTHNTIEDRYQRPTSEVGGVYSYEAIAPGTCFWAELRMRQSVYDALCQKQADWHEKLQGHHRIGQSKKDDYGAVDITVKIIQPERKTDTLTEDSKPTEKLWVWLLSDMLLRNESLRPTASVEDFRQALQQTLSANQQTLNAGGDESPIQLELSTPGEGLISAMLRSHRVESWQTWWNLPRPSLVGIAAGSCMVFEVTGTLDPQRLRQLELSGIGERTAEGYGQLCFNHPLLSEPFDNERPNRKTEEDSESQEAELDTPPPLLSASNRNSDVFDYARLIEKAAWREAIRRAALFLASEGDRRREILGIWIENKQGKITSHPSMSQLGGLRSVLSQLKFNQKEPVLSWIENIREKRSNKWEKTKDGLGKIERLIHEETQIWQWISTALCHADPNQNSLNYPSLQELTLTQTGESDLKQELWAEAVQVVIDACIRAHKRELEELEKKQEQAVVAAGANHGA
ncbi:RAMP superfamily CRISPR-associated protein [Thermoleptolyngbya sp. PKUAC-SCTB121]|uniref:RAMP superfamily CRISPR-associated protein n=1 Tax=Thermoleptolyngbya sp. PKUAC-SCTB121 TaxID=2811482 RepID=UPI001964377D|nr:RAMP superfamily CRISPR-associated protein [Thermoleptolyngbya sp. PKUAC-SCTB121]